MAKRGSAGAIFMVCFLAPFCLVGVITGYLSIRKAIDGDWKAAGFFAVFAVTFGGVGFGLLAATLKGSSIMKEEDARRTAHPDEPWLWKGAWTEGKIRGLGKQQIVGIWFFAIIWNALSCPVLFVLPRMLKEEEYAILIGLLFPLIGLALLAAAIRATIRRLKYGESCFELRPYPGVLGGKIAGVIHTSANIRPEDGFHLRLSNIHRYVTGSGKNRRTSESVLWQDEATMRGELLESDFSRSAIPVLFYVPLHLHASNWDNPNSQYLWRLEVNAATPGIDFTDTFEIPVFQTADSREDFLENYESVKAFRTVPSAEDIQAASKMISRNGQFGGKEFYQPPARHIGAVLFLAAFALVWFGAILCMVKMDAPFFFPVVFSLFGLLLMAGLLEMLGRSFRIEIVGGQVHLRTAWFGLGRSRNYNSDLVQEFIVVKGMQSGQTRYWDVSMKLKSGKKCCVANSIKDKREAEWFSNQLNEQLRSNI